MHITDTFEKYESETCLSCQGELLMLSDEIRQKTSLFSKYFDQFLKQHPLPVCANTNILKKDQYWRTMSLKSNEQGHLVMTAVVHPQSLSKVLWVRMFDEFPLSAQSFLFRPKSIS